jgi:hypothetical protein
MNARHAQTVPIRTASTEPTAVAALCNLGTSPIPGYVAKTGNAKGPQNLGASACNAPVRPGRPQTGRTE